MSAITTVDTGFLATAKQQRLSEACEHHQIVWMAIFGSVARGEAKVNSDVDVLVEFERDAQISYFDLEGIAAELSPLFDGRRVDIAKPNQLHWFIRDRVLSEARVLYAR